jgi:DNA-directed RNA polymerase alpha subunit
MKEPNESQPRASLKVAKDSTHFILSTAPFCDRGLSQRTIQALVDCSIDAPERLLFMTEDQLKNIPGAGKESLAEIRAYRDKFIR